MLFDVTNTTLPTAPSQPVIANPITGDYRIDALLDSATTRWNKDSPMGSAVSVTYSFMAAKPTYGGTDDNQGDSGFQAFTAEQKAAVRTVFARIAAETGLTFTEVSDSATSYGQIRFGNNTQASSAGYAFLPNSTGTDMDGDVWLDMSSPATLTNLAPGTYAWATLVHEIGHALGLKHPGNYNAGEPASTTPSNYLGVQEDNTNYTIMSYRDSSNGLQRDWYGAYDLLALHQLYGGGSEGSGDTRYAYDDTMARRMTTIYDAGGTDTLDISATTANATVDLRPGAFSAIGRGAAGTAPANDVTIDFTTTIENFIGSAANDTVTGNTANNRFALGAGTNSADGGAGIDTAVYAGAASAYRVTNSNGTLGVSGNGSTDTLTNVERIEFSDRKLAFDTSAQQVAKVIGAVFGASSVSNAAFEGIGLNLMDGGMSYQNLMQVALNFRLGPNASNADVVNLLYTNVVGSAPDAGTLANFTGFITSGAYTQASFGVLAADHPLNTSHIGLVGLAANGVVYG